MAIYKCMLSVMIMFMVLSYGNGEIVTQENICDFDSYDANRNCRTVPPYFLPGCSPHYVILITNVTVGYFNETAEQTCCQRMPDNICTVEANTSSYLGFFYNHIEPCILSRVCFINWLFYKWGKEWDNRNDNCTSADFLGYAEYMCVSDTSIINMTKPGMNHNLESLSLAYREDRYLEIDDHFYCSCEVTTDDDVYIYTRVDYVGLNVVYNTSVTIYSRDYIVRYDANNTDMAEVDIRGYKYLFYKQLKQTKGPIHLVYEGDQLQPDKDKIWIDFKVSQGRVKANCSGCQTGYSSPPIFGPRTTDSKGSMDSTTPAQPTSSSSDIYKTALISVLGIIAVLGLVTVGVVVYRKRKCTRNPKDTAKDVPTASRPTTSGTVYEIPLSRTVSNISETGSELYDTIHEQPTK